MQSTQNIDHKKSEQNGKFSNSPKNTLTLFYSNKSNNNNSKRHKRLLGEGGAAVDVFA